VEWYVILVLVLGIPLILFPAAYVWYLNIGGLYGLFKEAREKKAAREEATRAASEKHPANS